MDLFEGLYHIVQKYLPTEHVGVIQSAYRLAKEAHEGQFRSSGEPYITHPVAVATILAKMQLDYETIAAALLHDVIEDTAFTFDDLRARFGQSIAELVEGVSKLDKLKFRNRKEAEVENFRKMMMAMVQDIRVIFIKLADRTHNMRTLISLRPDKRRRIAKETLGIYAPLAYRLGINNLKVELEELGFEALHPIRYLTIQKAIESARNNRKEMIQRILLEIDNKLKNVGIHASIYAQEKTVYAIYTKMRLKEQRFHSIMDIFSFRIIVNDIDTCYRVLGQMHNLYKPRIGRFKDYISIPKANGYQSLHTTMVGPHGVPIAALIRTPEMNTMAELGIVASLTHKADTSLDNTTKSKVQIWIQSLRDLQQSTSNSFEFIDSVKSDLFPRHIYVFTPKGRIVELPAGSTPVDLAYAVHTDIGNHCIGARVDKLHSPLSKKLSNGQTVDIIVSHDTMPNADWLNFVVSSKARTKIRQTLKKLKLTDSIRLGHQLLQHELFKFGHRLDDINQLNITTTLKVFKVNTLNELLAEIGSGNIMSSLVVKSLYQCSLEQVISADDDKLIISGFDNILLSLAKCCQPIPDDPIVGFISPEKGLVIHRKNCPNLINLQQDSERFVPVKWATQFLQLFNTRIKITLINSPDLASKLTAVINQQNSIIQYVDSDEGDGHIYTVILSLQVKDSQHLTKVMNAIRALLNIISVDRE